MSGLLERIGRAAARRPWRTIAIWSLALVLLAGIASSAGGQPVDNFRLADSDARPRRRRPAYELPLGVRKPARCSSSTPRRGTLTGARHGEIEATLSRVGRLAHVAGISDPFAAGAITPDATIARAEVRYDRSTVDLGHNAYDRLKARLGPARQRRPPGRDRRAAGGVGAERRIDRVHRRAGSRWSSSRWSSVRSWRCCSR